MVSYKELGLVNTREMFAKAIKGGYAIPAFNFNNMEQMQAIVQACVETSSPVIMQVSSGARKYANPTILRYMAQGAVEYAKEQECIQLMTEDGIEVIELSGEELQEFKDVTAPIYDQWREVLGSDVMDQVLEMADKQ